jgi:hypothetical protein
MVKRIRLLVLFGAVAIALPLGLLPVGATETANSVAIQRHAQYDNFGFIIHVGLDVRCKKGTVPSDPGQVQVSVTQEPPETPYPMTAGSGLNNVVCDGQTRSVGVTITGAPGFDAGRATATATLFPPPGGGSGVTVTRTINIIVMNQGD